MNDDTMNDDTKTEKARAVRAAWEGAPERTLEAATALLAAHGFTAGPSWTTPSGRTFVSTWEGYRHCYGHPCVTLEVTDPGSPTSADVALMLTGAGCEPALFGHRLVRGVHHVRVRVQPAHRFGALEQHPETAGEGASLEAAIENALSHLAERVRQARAERFR